MAKITTPAKQPTLATVAGLPKIDLDRLFANHAANLAALRDAQDILVQTAQTVLKAQYGWAQEAARSFRPLPQKPEAVLADVKAAAEKAVAMAKQNVELGVVAQRRVGELLATRVAANVDSLKSIAA
jgi:hypothetical protein